VRADRAAGLFVALAGLALAALSASIDVLAGQPTLSARFFPALLSGVMIAGGLALALRPGETRLAAVLDALTARRGLAFAALFLVYALTFRHLDFRLGTWLFLLAAMWLLGARSRLELALVPAATALGTWVLFRHGFTVLLPTWT